MRTRIGQIQAKLGTKIVDKMSLFFDATLEETLIELIQNARRSKATRIDIRASPTRLSVEDDGQGIEKPERLLEFGRSGWTSPAVRAEKPAGMGLYSLAQHGATIHSRPHPKRDGAVRTGWTTTLRPAHFEGKHKAAVYEDPKAPTPHGTRIVLNANRIRPDEILHRIGRHVPIPIHLNGEAIEQKPFLDEERETYIEEWNGLRLILYKEPRGFYEDLAQRIDFHGLVIKDDTLPGAQTPKNSWWINVQVVGESGLELTLPTRAKVVRNSFHREMILRAYRTMYQGIAALSPDEPVSHAMWAAAKNDYGVQLCGRPQQLAAWQPSTADDLGYWYPRKRGANVDIDERTVIMYAPASTGEQQSLYRALNRMKEPPWQLVEHEGECEGFDWYENLPRLLEMHARITDNGVTNIIDLSGQEPEWDQRNRRVDRIELVLLIGKIREKRQRGRTVTIETDLTMAQVDSAYELTCASINVTRNSTIENDELMQLIGKAGFRTYPGGDIDQSYSVIHKGFVKAAAYAATILLTSREAATRARLQSIAAAEMCHYLQNDERATLTITAQGVETVVLAAPERSGASEAQPAAG